MSNIREDKGYTYGISSSIQTYPGSGLFAIATEAANEFVEPLIKEVYHVPRVGACCCCHVDAVQRQL